MTNDQLNNAVLPRRFEVFPIPGGDTVPARPPVRPVNGFKFP